MAKYVVYYNGEALANTELYTEKLVDGERTLIRMLGLGEVKGVKVLDEVLYTIRREDLDEAIKQCDCVQYAGIVLSRMNKLDSFKGKACIRITHDVPTFKDDIKGITYIKVRSIDIKNKYRLLEKLPVVCVCGVKYIPVEAYSNGEECSYYITIENKQ